MSQVGALAANLHEGSRSEYLAQYIFASFGTAVSVPHQEDTGVDLYCTLTERVGTLAWPKYHFTVQVKSTFSSWSFTSRESVRWLIEHPLPLFFCIVDKKSARIRVYHTFPRFLAWATGDLPTSLALMPEDHHNGEATQWNEGTTFSLGAPIVDRTISDLLDDEVWREVRAVLDSWLRAEQENLTRFAMRMPFFAMPYKYKTNTAGFTGGEIFQGSSLPHRVDEVRGSLGQLLQWLASAYHYQHDLPGMTRVALMLRYLYPEYQLGNPDAGFANHAVNQAVGAQSYVYDGVDQIAEALDAFLAHAPAGDA